MELTPVILSGSDVSGFSSCSSSSSGSMASLTMEGGEKTIDWSPIRDLLGVSGSASESPRLMSPGVDHLRSRDLRALVLGEIF